MSIESVMLSNHLILCCLLLPSVLPSIRVFSNELTLLIAWPKYWSFSFSVSLSNEHSRLISFRMDWLDLLAVQGTLKSLHQHHSSKASILQGSAYKSYMLSRFLICCLGLSQLSFHRASIFYFMAAVTICSDFRAQKTKSVIASTFSH